MIDFKAKATGTQIIVDWSTPSEHNSESFTLFQSNDGINYIQVDVLNAAGSSLSIKNYSSQITRPYIGINHFKLVQRDIDGEFEEFYTYLNYSDLKVSTSYPNPFKTKINMNLVVKNTPTEVKLSNIYGTLIYQKTFKISKSITIDTKDLVPGVYLLTIDGIAQKMIKQ